MTRTFQAENGIKTLALFSQAKELTDHLDEVNLQNKQHVNALNEEIDALKEQNQLLHDEIESLIETAEMKDEADKDVDTENPDNSDSLDPLHYPENVESEDGDQEGASQDDGDYDAENKDRVDSNTGEIIETPIDQEIHEVHPDPEEDHLPEHDSEYYNQGGNPYDDDHDNEEEPIEEDPVESETIIDNDQSNDENYQTNDELNNEINSEEEYQVEGYEPESSKFLLRGKHGYLRPTEISGLVIIKN